MAPRFARPAVRLLGDELQITRRRSTAVALSRGRSCGEEALRRWKLPNPRWPGKPHLRGLAAISRTAEPQLSSDPQHRAYRRALAHAHENARGSDSGKTVAAGVARNES